MIRLVIFDINGILCRKIADPVDETCIQRSHYWVKPRPGVAELIKALIDEGYHVGVWSSTTSYNAIPMLDAVIDDELKEQLKFIWCRERVEMHPHYGLDPKIREYDTIKDLHRIWSHSYFNRKYQPNNTIIIDDSWIKLINHPEMNSLIVEPYQVDENDEDWAADLWLDLETRFKYLALLNNHCK